jgi:MtN3 and saliva related transmembrane protein
MPCGASKLGSVKNYLLVYQIKKMNAIQLLGLAAGTITSITFLPQVIQIWKTKSVKDLSMQMLLLLILGVTMWLTYGILVKDAAIIYTNSMVLTMSLVMMYFKFKFK